MALTMESTVFMGLNYQNNCNSIASTTDFTLKHMFDIFTKLVSEQDEISGLETFGWENHSWKYLSLIGDERIINLQRTKVYVCSDSVLCLGKIQQNPESNEAWEQRLGWIKSSQSYRDFDGISGEPTEFEWNIIPGFDTLQLCDKVKSLLSRLGVTPENFTGRILIMSMFNDTSCGTKDNEKECLANARLVSLYARKVGKGQWSFIGLGSEKKWYSMREDSPQGIWDNLAERMLIEFAESGCTIFRATTLLYRGQLKSKGHGKLSIHFAAVQETIDTIFRGQYFMTKHTDEFLQFAQPVTCREYTLPRNDGSSQPRGSISVPSTVYAGEERVTAKSKPMMNLVSRYRVRDPNVLASTASESSGKTKSESQNVPLSSLNVQQTRTERPVYDKFVIDDDMD